MSEEREHRRSVPRWLVVLRSIAVVVIIGIGMLGAWVFPNVMHKLFMSDEDKARTDISVISQAIVDHMLQHNGAYPHALEELVTAEDTDDPFRERAGLPTDPWGNAYGYVPPLSGEPFRVYTYGADGAPGGEGLNADIDLAAIKAGTSAQSSHEHE